jgi:NAD(P)-dependent dehydrogenase (short-subunit alcohol dehydrogenase family)
MKAMLERNWGRIIFLSSESGLNIPDDMLHYGFAKTAVCRRRAGSQSWRASPA